MFSRFDEIHRIRQKLERNGYPRLQMLFIVAITGGVGFIASYTLHKAGFDQMWSRYLLAFCLAYVVFLFLLWVWIRTRKDDYADISDISGMDISSGQEKPADISGKGGEFGGGGASRSYDKTVFREPSETSSVSDSGVLGEALESAAVADEFAIPAIIVVAVLIAATSLFFMSFYFVYSAPVFFAELLVDALLAAGLYRRLQKLEQRHWLNTAIKNTFWPFMLTAILAAIAGGLMAYFVPGAQSVGDVLFN